ncbi:hypothetical protein PCE1_000252 [Barthelona sp. PCE]
MFKRILFVTLLIFCITLGQMEVVSNSYKYQNAAIFEQSAAPWLYALSQKYGTKITFANIPDAEINFIVDFKFDLLYLLGVWQKGEIGPNLDRNNPDILEDCHKLMDNCNPKVDIIGSPFSIVEFVVAEEFGGNEGLAVLRQQLKRHGVGLMLDYVPNHTALDSPNVEACPECYIRCPEGWDCDPEVYYKNGIAFGSSGKGDHWRDVAQLNYWEPKTMHYSINNMLAAASMCDALRVDMAMVVMNDNFENSWKPQLDAWGYSRPTQEFWSYAIKQVKAKFGTYIIGEQYWHSEGPLQNLGFDALYDKENLLDDLKSLNVRSVSSYVGWRKRWMVHMVKFLGNHDEPTIWEEFHHNFQISKAAGMIAFTLPGPRFFWAGQMTGQKTRLKVQFLRRHLNPVDSDLFGFYQRLANVYAHPTLNQDPEYWTWIPTSNNNVVAWVWSSKVTKKNVLVVVNYSGNDNQWESIKLDYKPDHAGGAAVEFKELISGTTYSRNIDDLRSTGLHVGLSKWTGQIFEF